MSTAPTERPLDELPIPLRRRADLQVRRIAVGGRAEWRLKDPLTLQCYRLRDEEYFLFAALDGRVTWSEIRAKFERQFAPGQLHTARWQAFLAHFHRAGLLLADRPGQGERLWERRSETRQRAWTRGLERLLAWRFRGVDPTPLLDWLAPRCRWLFAPLVLGTAAAFVLATGLFVAARCDELAARLPDAQRFFAADNLLWLAVTLSATKLLHELGHAVTLRHWGGECHELGVMLLIFTPCLYCDASDASMLPLRRQRAAVAGAGIAVDLFLAAVAAWLWWFLAPGRLASLCLNVLVMCSVGSLLFNANPLLRYDGYFVLSDLCDVPNLWQRSRAVVRKAAADWWFGPRAAEWPESAPWRLGLYGAASMLYRGFVLFGIALFLQRWFVGHDQRLVGNTLASLLVAGATVGPLANVAKHAANPARRRAGRGAHRLLTLLGLALLIGLTCVPWPRHVAAPVLFEPSGAERVYVTVAGTLVDGAATGTTVRAGDLLARLDQPELQRESARLAGEQARWQARLTTLEARRGSDPQAAALIPATREALRDAEDRQQQLARDFARLTLRASRPGTVFAVADMDGRDLAQPNVERLVSPLDPQTRGRHLPAGTLLCLVGDPSQWEAVAFVSPEEIEHLRVGQPVRLRATARRGVTLRGVVTEVAKVDLDRLPRELQHLPALATPAGSVYQARIGLDSPAIPLFHHGGGSARIRVAPASLWQRLDLRGLLR